MKTVLNVALMLGLLSAFTNNAFLNATTLPPNSIKLPDAHEGEIIKISADQLNQASNFRDLNDVIASLGIQSEPKRTSLQSASFDYAIEPNLRSGAPQRIPDRSEDHFIPSVRKSGSSDRYLENPSWTVCNPELTSVDLQLEESSGVRYFPKCVKVNRCGGCCDKAKRTCKATNTNNVIVKVIKLTEADFHDDSMYLQQINVTVEEHSKCGCECKLTASDCDPYSQEHNPADCTCRCKNLEAIGKCFQRHNGYYWDSDTCKCKCKNIHDIVCSSGRSFSDTTCKCERSKPAGRSRSFDSFVDNLRRTESRLRDEAGSIQRFFST